MTPLARHGTVLFISESMSSGLMIISGFLIARGLSVGEFGAFTAALSLVSIFAIMADSGMGMLAARDIARGTPDALTALDRLFSWRLLVITFLWLSVPVMGILFLGSVEARHLALILTPALFLQGLVDFFCWIFKGAQRAVLCAALQISSRLLLLGGILLALHSTQRLKEIETAYIVVNLLASIAGFLLINATLHPLRVINLPRSFFSKTVPGIYRLGAILILGVAFSRIDVVLVARLRGQVDAGLYAAANRLLDGVRLVPMMAYSVFLTIFSALHDQPEELRPKFLVAYEVALFTGFAAALIGSSFGRLLLTRLLGAPYAAAEPCLRALLWSAVPLCINILIFALLYALGDQRTPLIGIAVAIGLEVILDLLWLPQGSIVSAGWIRVIADSANGLILAVGLLRKGIVTSQALLLRPALLAFACIGLLWILRDQSAFLRLLCPLSVCTAIAFLGSPQKKAVMAWD